MENIKNNINDLEVGKIQTYKNLSIAPILGEDSPLEHIVLADALSAGFEITEKGGGSVPVLYVVNNTGENVLAIAGEYVKGGRQNRTITRNVYFDKEFEGDLPVKCVQEGRWDNGNDIPYIPTPSPWDPWRHPRPGPFGPTHLPIFRCAGHAPISAAHADSQQETWSEIRNTLNCFNVSDSTKDLDAVYRKRKGEFDKYKENFPILDNQIGNIAVISKGNKEIFVLDLFDRNEILEKHHDNLVSSYALEAGRSKNKGKINKNKVRRFLDSLSDCNFTKQKPVSIGTDYTIKGSGLIGSCLVYKGNIAYMNYLTKNKPRQRATHLENPEDPFRFDGGDFTSGFHRQFR